MVGSERLSNRLLNIYLPLVFYLVFLLFPFYWMTIVSLKPTNDLFDMKYNPFWIQKFTLENYLYLFRNTAFPQWVENTLIVCSGAENALFQVLILPQGKTFIRGDADGDGQPLNLADVITIAQYLFRGAAAPSCLDAADSNDDGEVDISDAVYILFFLFIGGSPAPPLPYPGPGTDPTFLDNLEC